MKKWHQKIADLLGSKHSDTQAVIHAGKKDAKRRSNRRVRKNKIADIQQSSEIEE